MTGRRSRIIGAGLLIALALTSLSGCTAIGSFVQNSAKSIAKVIKPAAGEAVAGDCWQATYAGAIQYADWSLAKPVSCASKHQLYTFAVVQLHSKFTGGEFASSGELKLAIQNQAFSGCLNYQNAHFGETDSSDGRFELKVYVPRTAQWTAGARWVRCDFNVFAIGSNVQNPTLANLPSGSVLESELRSDPGIFDFCVNVPGSTAVDGPLSDSAVFASCTSDPQWVLRGYFQPLPLEATSYPTPAAFKALYADQCQSRYTDASHITFPSYVSKDDWDSGNKGSECWVGRKS